MRLLLTLALTLLLSSAAFAQSKNPLLGPGPDTVPTDPAPPAVDEPPADTGPEKLSFEDYGLSLEVNGGGLVRRPGDEGWDYGPSVVGEWNHETAEIYRVLVMVDEFESPITDIEFDLLAGTYYNGFIEDQAGTEHISTPRDFEVDGRTWRCFTVDLAYDDGYRCVGYNLLAWEAHRLYTIVCYIEAADTSPDDIRRNPGWPTVRGLLDGLAVTPPPPLAGQPFKRREIPGHGLALELPESGHFLPAGTPETAAMRTGPMECAFYWALPSAPAHEVIWFTIAKDEEFTPAEYTEFVDGLWLGLTGGTELEPAPVELAEFGGNEWTWGETGYTDPETPETNTLVYLCRQPGVIHMVLANTNRGYVAAGREQVEGFLETVAFGEYSRELPEYDQVSIEEPGLYLELPGGGMLARPGDPDWEFPDNPDVVFQWVHFDSAVSECRLAMTDLGATLGAEEFKQFEELLAERMVAEKGAAAAEVLEPVTVGDRTWHVVEYTFAGDDLSYKEVIYVASEFNMLYCLYFDYEPGQQDDARAIARHALETFTVE